MVSNKCFVLSLVLIAAPAPPCRPRTEYNEKCLADELQEALIHRDSDGDVSNDGVFVPSGANKQLPKVYPKYSNKFLEELTCVKFNSVSKNTRAYLNSDNVYLQEDSSDHSRHSDLQERSRDQQERSRDQQSRESCVATGGKGQKDGGDGVYIFYAVEIIKQ